MIHSFSACLHDWQSFYALTGEVAGTLIGLMFIAMSMGSNRLASIATGENNDRLRSKIRTFISPTIIHLSAVVVTAAIMSMPIRSPANLSVCLGGIGGVGLIYVVAMLRGLRYRARQQPLGLDHWIFHFHLPCLGYTTIFACALILLLTRDALLALGAVVVLFLVISIRNSWLASLYMSGMLIPSEQEPPR